MSNDETDSNLIFTHSGTTKNDNSIVRTLIGHNPKGCRRIFVRLKTIKNNDSPSEKMIREMSPSKIELFMLRVFPPEQRFDSQSKIHWKERRKSGSFVFHCQCYFSKTNFDRNLRIKINWNLFLTLFLSSCFGLIAFESFSFSHFDVIKKISDLVFPIFSRVGISTKFLLRAILMKVR